MNKEELVSAVVITYNRPVEILKRAVTSVINQTYSNFELIVVNDYPENSQLKDEIKMMLDSFNDNRIRYIVHKKNMGACKARNTGILQSSGEYVCLLDDDDEWLPNKMKLQMQGFKDDSVGLVYSPFYNVKGNSTSELAVRGTKSGRLLQDMLRENCVGGTSMTMLKREVFEKCGMFDENLLSSQDYDLWVRVAMKYNFCYVDVPLTIRHMQEDSITSNFSKQLQGFEYFNNKHASLYERNSKAFNYRCNRRANKWYEQGHFKEAWGAYKLAIKACPISIYNISEPIKGIIKFFYLRILK